MIKTTMKLDITELRNELESYKEYRSCSKYKDDKATVLIALKPPRYTKMRCYGRIPTEHTYIGYTGMEETYTRYEKDYCPYKVYRSDSPKYYGNGYVCGLFGARVGYRGYRLGLCKFVFGKSKKMIKSWRPLKEIEIYLRNLGSKKVGFQIDRLLQDTHIGKREHTRATKALLAWVSGDESWEALDDIITKALSIKGVSKKVSYRLHMGEACTPGGTLLYARH